MVAPMVAPMAAVRMSTLDEQGKAPKSYFSAGISQGGIYTLLLGSD